MKMSIIKLSTSASAVRQTPTLLTAKGFDSFVPNVITPEENHGGLRAVLHLVILRSTWFVDTHPKSKKDKLIHSQQSGTIITNQTIIMGAHLRWNFLKAALGVAAMIQSVTCQQRAGQV
jgi:hypothetical protein